MHRLLSLASPLLVCCLLLPTEGCSNKDSKPNPNLKVPDIPPAGRDSKGGVTKQPGKK
jgi:hypothetical protein